MEKAIEVLGTVAAMEVTINIDWTEEIVSEKQEETYNGNLLWAVELFKNSEKFIDVLNELEIKDVDGAKVILKSYNNNNGLNFTFVVGKK